MLLQQAVLWHAAAILDINEYEMDWIYNDCSSRENILLLADYIVPELQHVYANSTTN